jgi:hypothetical protein
MDTIEQDVLFTLIASPIERYTVPTSMIYSAHDPYAISMYLTTEGATRLWEFSRELLDAGTMSTAGEGDVRITPMIRGDGVEVVHIRISSPDGTALLETVMSDIKSFLVQSYMLVPSGTESKTALAELDTIDWDAL